MNQLNNKWAIVLIIAVGTVISILRGTEARQKWLFKIKNRIEEKRQLAEHKLLRSGGVELDDVEIQSFHS